MEIYDLATNLVTDPLMQGSRAKCPSHTSHALSRLAPCGKWALRWTIGKVHNWVWISSILKSNHKVQQPIIF